MTGTFRVFDDRSADSTYRDLRRWTYEIFAPELGGRLGRWVDWAIMALIAANVVAIVLETVDPIAASAAPLFRWFEIVSVAIFSIEYLARVWSYTEDEDYNGIISGRVKYASRPLLVVDLVAILPFYLTAGGADLRGLRALRLVRIVRLAKLARYSEAIRSFGRVFREKREELVLAAGVNGVLLVVASSAMYYAEHQHQPEVFSSIPAAFYWAVITLTTVGYGDVTPVTTIGKILAGLIAALGIGLFALPASILASGFMEQAESDSESDWCHCPHCGEKLEN